MLYEVITYNAEGFETKAENILITTGSQQALVITSYSIHYTKLYEELYFPCDRHVVPVDLCRREIRKKWNPSFLLCLLPLCSHAPESP